MTAILLPLQFLISFSSALFPHYWWEQIEISQAELVVHQGMYELFNSYMQYMGKKYMHYLCFLFFGFFFNFYYLLILVATYKMYFVTALTHHVVASKKIPYFSNSACMLSRKQSKTLSELREEEEDAE